MNPIDESAADSLIRAARAFPGELRVLAIGPCTNLALALRTRLAPGRGRRPRRDEHRHPREHREDQDPSRCPRPRPSGHRADPGPTRTSKQPGPRDRSPVGPDQDLASVQLRGRRRRTVRQSSRRARDRRYSSPNAPTCGELPCAPSTKDKPRTPCSTPSSATPNRSPRSTTPTTAGSMT
jgi:hypothetical protein